MHWAHDFHCMTHTQHGLKFHCTQDEVAEVNLTTLVAETHHQGSESSIANLETWGQGKKMKMISPSNLQLWSILFKMIDFPFPYQQFEPKCLNKSVFFSFFFKCYFSGILHLTETRAGLDHMANYHGFLQTHFLSRLLLCLGSLRLPYRVVNNHM